MSSKALRLSSIILALNLGLIGCGGTETKDSNDPPKKVDEPKPSGGSPKSEGQPLDLTGTWTRDDGATFKAIDSVQTVTLDRELTAELAEVIEFYRVELVRKGEALSGEARFRYRGDDADTVLDWKLKANGDYEYAVTSESVAVENGKEVRKTETFTLKIAPKFPPPVKEPEAPASEPASEPASPAGGEVKVMSDAEVQAAVEKLKGDDRSAAAEAAKALLRAGDEARMPLEDANYALEEDFDKRCYVAMLQCFRKEPVGLQSFNDMRESGSLGLTQTIRAERYYQISLCGLMPVPGVKANMAAFDSVLTDPRGEAAGEMAAKGKEYIDTNKAWFAALDWLKGEEEWQRRTAEIVLFPSGQALGGAYGEYAGSVYASYDDKGQRDAAADEFRAWFDENVRPKLQ